jgi:hypothetical protein
MAEAGEAIGGKARKRPSAKAAGGLGEKKVKATIHLTLEADERLSIHAIKMGMDRSMLVEWLVSKYLRRWVVSDRGEPEGGGETAA